MNIHVFAVLFLLSSTCFAGGTEVGGGGEVLKFKNNQVVLADQYGKPIPGTRLDLPKQLMKLQHRLEQMGRVAEMYGADADFFLEDVTGPYVEYRLVKDLPKIPECQGRMALEYVGSGTKPLKFGCTKGYFTWIRREPFFALSPIDQALGLIHERLHLRVGEDQHQLITDFTNAMHVLLDLFEAQADGKTPVLASWQVEQIEVLMRRIRQIGIGKHPRYKVDLSMWAVDEKGGGLKHRFAQIDPSAYIGAGVILNKESVVEEGVKISGGLSACYFERCIFRRNAQWFDSMPWRFYEAGMLKFDTLLEVDEAAFVKNSFIGPTYLDDSQGLEERGLYVGKRSKILNSNLGGFVAATHIDSDVSITNVQISNAKPRQLLLVFQHGTEIKSDKRYYIHVGNPSGKMRWRIQFAENTVINWDNLGCQELTFENDHTGVSKIQDLQARCRK